MDLIKLIKQNLTVSQYEELPFLMRLTPYRTTVIQNRPETMTAAEIARLVEVINNPEITPEYLINTLDCGLDTMNAREYVNLTKSVAK